MSLGSSWWIKSAPSSMPGHKSLVARGLESVFWNLKSLNLVVEAFVTRGSFFFSGVVPGHLCYVGCASGINTDSCWHKPKNIYWRAQHGQFALSCSTSGKCTFSFGCSFQEHRKKMTNHSLVHALKPKKSFGL